jgi:hypothetical protein
MHYRFILMAALGLTCFTSGGIAEEITQQEFTTPLPLLGPDGSLAAAGWARRAMMAYNRETIPTHLQGRTKEWEHYTIMSPEFTVGITIAQLGSMAFGSAELIDYRAGTNTSSMFLDLRSKDQSIFPADPYGRTDFRRGKDHVTLAFDADRRQLDFSIQGMGTAPPMTGSIELADPKEQDSIAIARPFAEPGHFFYENKIVGMPATGKVQIGEHAYELPSGTSFAIFDWGRGIWPRDSAWFWGQASGEINGHRLAINLGHGYGDDRHGTANAFFVDGKIDKLTEVTCDFDPEDRMKPWHFRSDDGRLVLTFTPIYPQESKQNIGIAAAELHKIHGYYNGTLVTSDGQKIPVSKLLGFAEHMSQKW